MNRRPLLIVSAILALAVTASASALAAKRSDGSKPLPAAIAKSVTSVPQEALDRIGAGAHPKGGEFTIKDLGGSASAAGKVHVISYNAAWCPHCAANSWALAVALSHFGTLGGLRGIDTGTFFEKKLEAKPAYSHTKGLSFLDATYASTLVKFEPVVANDLHGHLVQRLNGAQKGVIKSFDPELGFPAVAVGEDFGFAGSGYSPAVIFGKSPATIAAALSDPRSPIARAIDGEANVITAAICLATDDRPEEICTSAAVTKAGHRLPGR